MDEDTTAPLGKRLREVRVWRGLSLRAVAELAGFSAAYLSLIEQGKRPVDKRSTLDALATALRVSPAELLDGARWSGAGHDLAVARAVSAMGDVEAALTDVEVGDVAVPRPSWAEVTAGVARFDHARITADYAGIMTTSAWLIPRLNALVTEHAAPRAEVLATLVQVYMGAGLVTRNLGARGLPSIAALHARQAAELADDPVLLALASWTRAHTFGSGARARMRQLALDTADDLAAHLARREARELHGMLSLTAALAAAVQRDADTAHDHLDEAAQMAESMPETAGSGYAHLSFGRMNVAIWRVTLAVELGENDRVATLREQITPDILESHDRRAGYWGDLGRALATSRDTRPDAVAALLSAERDAPVRTRSNAYVRDTVATLLPALRRDSDAGRELRGLAYRMGLPLP